MTEIREFFEDRIPAEWFAGPPGIESDEEEILCVGALPPGVAADGFREATRQERMAIAREAESRFGRVVRDRSARSSRRTENVSLPSSAGYGGRGLHRRRRQLRPGGVGREREWAALRS